MSASIPDILKYLSNNKYSIMEDHIGDAPLRAKKRRLDHLSWEEKIQRKKLKNRVAAQTSRDRKKAKMEQMESALREVFEKNENLLSECDSLRQLNEKLQTENAELNRRLREPCPNCVRSRSVECVVQNGSAESNLLPQGVNRHSAAISKSQTVRALWKIVIACLLYQTFSTNSTKRSISTRWKNSHKASSKISPQTWKLLLKKQITKNQKLVPEGMLQKWWGKHQNNWNPMDVRA